MLASKMLKDLKNYYYLAMTSKIIMFAMFCSLTTEAQAGYRQSFISFETKTGTVLSKINPYKKVYPASMTKILTAHIILRDIEDLDQLTTISNNAWGHRFGNSSRMFLEPGMRVSVESLLLGLMVQSGNDAAVALAELHSGTVEDFAVEMNKTANHLGAKNSNFINPHGRHNRDHYTTAYDFMQITSGVLKLTPEINNFTQEEYFTFNGITQYNRNKAIKHPSNIGLKTGFTPQSGYNLTSCYAHNNGNFCTIEFGNEQSGERFSNTFNEFENNFRLRKVFTIPVFKMSYSIGDSTYNLQNHTEKHFLGLKTDTVKTELILEKYPNRLSKVKSSVRVTIDGRPYIIDLPSTIL